MKKLFALLLAVCMVFALCACGGLSMDQIGGTWGMKDYYEADEAASLLENLGFYEEEYSLIDTTAFYWYQCFELNADNTYRYYDDYEATKEGLIDGLDTLLDAIYENLDDLYEIYGAYHDDFADADEFKEAYAVYIYEFESYDEFLSEAADYALRDGYGWDGDYVYESGTFKISGTKLVLTPTDEEGATVEVESEDNWLTLTYADGIEEYTRVK